jgi:hypothetical protein
MVLLNSNLRILENYAQSGHSTQPYLYPLVMPNGNNPESLSESTS